MVKEQGAPACELEDQGHTRELCKEMKGDVEDSYVANE